MRRYGYLLVVMIVIAMLLAITCSKDQPSGTSTGNDAVVSVSFLKSSLLDQITTIDLQVLIDSNECYTDQVTIDGGEFQFESFELPAGEARFILSALDSSEAPLYTGDTTVTVIADVENTIQITLLPAVPMVKLSPYYSTVEVDSHFISRLEIFNIARFINGSFRITFNSTMIAFDTAVAQSNTGWGTLNILTTTIDNTVVLSVSRTSDSDLVPPNSYSLADIGFHALAPGMTQLQLSVNYIQDSEGTISEITNLHKDHQIIEITGSDTVDIVSPETVSDLSVENTTATSVTLIWTAPGDDGNSGTASAYDVRYSNTNIVTNNDWQQANAVTGEPTPQPAGSNETMVVDNLNSGITYYFALKTVDESDNWSEISNVVSATPEEVDSIPPAAVSNLHVDIISEHSVTLTWTAPGDDGNTGTAAEYDIRYLTMYVIESNWIIADECADEPEPNVAGSIESYIVTNLEPNTTYYFAIKTRDNLDNWSTISNVDSAITLPIDIVSIPDSNLEAAIRDELNKPGGDILESELQTIINLSAVNRDIADLAGLEYCTNIQQLLLDSNQVSNLNPLSGLANLARLSLSYNEISDIAPIYQNNGIDSGDEVWLYDNPLSTQSISIYIPALEERGVTVYWDEPPNHAPVIDSVDASPATVYPEGSSTITVFASDEDGDSLTYEYSVTGGTITPSGNLAFWEVPNTPGLYTVTVTVSDGELQDQAHADIGVQQPPTRIQGTLTLDGSGDLENTRVAIFTSFDDWDNGNIWKSITTTDSGVSVTYTIDSVLAGTYYLDAWKDIDTNGYRSSGDLIGWYSTDGTPNGPLTQFSITQNETKVIDVRMIVCSFCQYIDISGQAEIVYADDAPFDQPNCTNNPYEVKFNFTPDDQGAINNYILPTWPDTNLHIHVAGNLNPALGWVLAEGLIIGTFHKCIRREELAGSCVPVVFEFPDVDFSAGIDSCYADK